MNNILLDKLKSSCLVYDIETYAENNYGKEININSQFDEYISFAKIKWFGAYSYKDNKYYSYKFDENYDKIQLLLLEHDILVGFNSEEFDFPILKNNGVINEEKYYTHIDCMMILGKAVYINKSGFKYKDRGTLMNYNFKKNSLKAMAEEMKLDFQKGEIDYTLFKKNVWTSEEENIIENYLKNDVMATKQMFDKLWDFWKPFTKFLNIKHTSNLSWIRNSIASLTYKSACSLMNVEPTYSEKVSSNEEMGGRVIMPKYEEAKNVWYVDFASLYPHIFCMFNLFAETEPNENNPLIWHGNNIFKVRGNYYIGKQHELAEHVSKCLEERIHLKETDPKNPMVYTLKIFLNGLYGAVRSSIFEKIHTPNAGWDCCWLGQQIQQLTEKMMDEFGFESIYGDTDSLMLIAKEEKYNNREYVKECLNKIIRCIDENVPFPVDTFEINIENYIDYILFPFSEQPIQDENGNNIKEKNRLVKERKGKKKNYLYIYTEKDEKKIKLVGLPIIKDNATKLGIKIYNEVLKELIIKNNNAKFSKQFITDTINSYLEKDEIMALISREYKVKTFKSYKNPSQLQAQISKNYFDGRDGIINLIKNNKIGKVGKGMMYCTVKEANEKKLKIEDLDLEKLWNEVEPFIENIT